MSLVLKTAASDPPTSDIDWTRTQNLITMLFLGNNGPILRIVGGSIVKGSVFQIGGAIYHANTDTAISGSETNYVKITPAGSTASAEYVADLSGVDWNDEYNGWLDDDGNLYLFDEIQALDDEEITQIHNRFVGVGDDGKTLKINVIDADIDDAEIDDAEITNAEITNADIGNSIKHGFGYPSGADESVIDIGGTFGFTHLPDTNYFIFIGSVEKRFRLAYFDGSWTQSYASSELSAAARPRLAGLDSTHFAFLESSTDNLVTYEVSGSSVSSIGNPLYLSGFSVDSSMTAIDSTHVVIYDTLSDTLKAYEWSHSTLSWSATASLSIPTGSGVTVAITSFPGTNKIAFYENQDHRLSVYELSGSTFVKIGISLNTTDDIGAGIAGLSGLDENNIAFASEGPLRDLRMYGFYENILYKAGSSVELDSTADAIAIASLNSNQVAVLYRYDPGDGYSFRLRMYNSVKAIT
jgi:hypothetical protein